MTVLIAVLKDMDVKEIVTTFILFAFVMEMIFLFFSIIIHDAIEYYFHQKEKYDSEREIQDVRQHPEE